LLALYGAVIFARNALPSAALPEPGYSIALAAALVLLGAGAFRLRDRLQRHLDRPIFKDSYDYRAALQQLSYDLSLVAGLESLGSSLAGRLLHLMNLEFAMLLVHSESGPRVHGAAGALEPALLPALTTAAQQVPEVPRVMPLRGSTVAVLLIPLRTRGTLVGHLCLGPKARGEPFRAEDRALLTTLSSHLAAIVHNVQLVDDLQAKVELLEAQKAALDTLNERLQRTHEEERARLAADLHDEPLQTALRLQRLLIADGCHDAVAAHHIALADALVDQMRTICTAAGPAALDELGLAADLEVLALELGAHSGVPILLDADPELKELALSPDTKLLLYRTAQEALHNALRHACARIIRITLRRDADTVQLRVADDGSGFAVPAHMDALVTVGRLGLAGLYRRVQRAGGRFCVTSAPGQGTVVEVEFHAAAA
jgi:signal transduction histidine kinase